MAEHTAGSTVLLVEDNPALSDNLAEILEGAGYAVRAAGGCAAAREAAHAGFDVALVDVRLPDGDGIRLAPELKALVPDAEVILLTGFATLESAIGAVRAGAWAYLVKPCAPPDLLIALKQAMRQVRLQREKHELSRRAQTSEKLAALGVMAAGLAHEIRNPLNAGQLQLQLAERRLRSLPAAPPADVVECLGLVRAEMDRLNHIVEEILDFARPAALRLERGDLAQTVSTVARFLEPDAAAAGVALRVVGAEAPLQADYDEGRIKQVLMNLVRNGVEAAGSGGEVAIRLSRQGAGVELVIEDTGPGVPDGVDPLVPFFTTKARGTGLGLSTAHRIVTEHGGTLFPTRRDGRTAFVAQLPGVA
jgi:two-component system, NtrC family, sensor histidine kinase HydH